MTWLCVTGIVRSGMSAISPSASNTCAARLWQTHGRVSGVALLATTTLAQSCLMKPRRHWQPRPKLARQQPLLRASQCQVACLHSGSRLMHLSASQTDSYANDYNAVTQAYPAYFGLDQLQFCQAHIIALLLRYCVGSSLMGTMIVLALYWYICSFKLAHRKVDAVLLRYA